MSGILFHIKVSLMHSSPEIWRRFQIPGSYTLDELHDTLQAIMGWDNEHLYQFIINEQFYGDSEELGSEGGRNDATVITLSHVIKRKTSFTYEYDFGDGWEHEITVEKIGPLPTDFKLPVCTEGENACPPEDCGGIFGYYELLAALADPNHPDHQEMVDTYGADLKPEAFDLDWANRNLKEIFS